MFGYREQAKALREKIEREMELRFPGLEIEVKTTKISPRSKRNANV